MAVEFEGSRADREFQRRIDRMGLGELIARLVGSFVVAGASLFVAYEGAYPILTNDDPYDDVLALMPLGVTLVGMYCATRIQGQAPVKILD